ncbi:YIEGIA domain-containing protein [Senegalia massiliensis]|uniref:YIEGIA protein n=1 Tax=Senegalia massiliensis TaxID=1720316 RepID=A0A845R1I2_9CLOT|nr:YIEGIA domain-containing protein [Senegalia massiliensis]NBI08124.1 YIEGIA protein [Senegalia massiliensis]
MEKQILQSFVLLHIVLGVIVGFISRWWMLRGDIRQYPTLPNGYLINLTTGFIAASIGAVAYPALLAKNYVAVTFLTVAIQQFRDIRKMEKETLESLETENYAPRGKSYIDGIAKTFEARNYIVMISSFVTTISAFIVRSFIKNNFLIIPISLLIGFIVLFFLKNYTKGHTLRDILTITEAPLEFKDGSNLYVGNMYVMNVGLSATQTRILKNGIGIIMKPIGENEKVMLNHSGQRKAIVHECSRLLGVERYIETRRNFDNGNLALVIVPMIKDITRLKEIIYDIPILEMTKKTNDKKKRDD